MNSAGVIGTNASVNDAKAERANNSIQTSCRARFEKANAAIGRWNKAQPQGEGANGVT
jgi:hypothetical protein